MFAHITQVLMIRLNRYEGVIAGGRRSQDARCHSRVRIAMYAGNGKHAGRYDRVWRVDARGTDPGCLSRQSSEKKMQLIFPNRDPPSSST